MIRAATLAAVTLALAGCQGGGSTESAQADTPAAQCIAQDTLGCVPPCFVGATCLPASPETDGTVVNAPLASLYVGEPLTYNASVPVYYAGAGDPDSVGMTLPQPFAMVQVTWPDGTTHQCSTFWLKE